MKILIKILLKKDDFKNYDWKENNVNLISMFKHKKKKLS